MSYYNSLIETGVVYTDRVNAFKNAGISDVTILNALNVADNRILSSTLNSKLKYWNPIVGGSSIFHRLNFIDITKFIGVFTSGWTHSSSGMISNGTSAFMNTNFNPSLELAVNNCHFGFSLNLGRVGSSGGLGSLQSNVPGSLMYAAVRYVDDYYYSFIGEEQTVISSSRYLNAETKGIYINSRTSSTSLKQYKNGVLKNTVTGVNNGTLPNRNMYIGAMNVVWGVSYVNDSYTSMTYGDGLTDSEALLLTSILNEFNTALSRNVY
jgi:hypothetical protein